MSKQAKSNNNWMIKKKEILQAVSAMMVMTVFPFLDTELNAKSRENL